MRYHRIAQITENRNPKSPEPTAKLTVSGRIDYFRPAARPPCSTASPVALAEGWWSYTFTRPFFLPHNADSELGSHERHARIFGRAQRVSLYKPAVDIGALGSVVDPPADAGNAVIYGALRHGMTFIANS
jgi:hypothetical protein